jgi:peptidoglycan/xylan/chitin deacetylase (PgdA/CDA1 family)
MVKLFTRRKVIKTLGLGSAGVLASSVSACRSKPTHIITLSFDDGFEKSSIRTAEIYEKYGLSACINVIASKHLMQGELTDEYHTWPAGDFKLWNDLKKRGHEIMPHSYRHANLTELPLGEAKNLIIKCMDMFREELEGFVEGESIYNFAYNASNKAIEEWLEPRVRAFRTGGGAVNPFPFEGMKRLTCTSYGPDNIDNHLEETINQFLEGPSGWLIYNTHGLDEEGWGPMSSVYLDELLDRLTRLDAVAVLPVVPALDLT